jgi:hypothetical protein
MAVLVAALLPGGALQAQQPMVFVPICQPLPPAPAATVPCCPPASRDSEDWFALQAMFGQESGLRGQVPLLGDRHSALVVEGFVGWLFNDLRSSGALGAGARYLIQTDWSDAYNSIRLGPGVDVFFQDHGLILLTPSIDLSWGYRLTPGLEWEVGLDVGLGIGMNGHTRHDNSALGDLVPLVSVFTGLRF